MIRVFLFAAMVLNLAGADRSLKSEAAPTSIFFSKDGKSITSRCRDGHVRTWDLASGKLVSDKKFAQRAVQLSSDLMMEANDETKSMKIWDLSADRQLQLIHGVPASTMALSSDRRFVATSRPEERTVRIWDLASGKEKHTLPDGIGGAAGLTFSPDGETVVSANYDNDIRVWKTQSGELVKKVEDMTGTMFASAFSPDGKQLIMAGLDETVYIWDAKTFALTRKLKGHGETIASLAISPNGRTLVTGGFDVITVKNPVKLSVWDMAAGKIVKTIAAPHRVARVAFSPDGNWVAFLTGDTEISLVEVN
jgi:WD40 repeat protein